MLKSQAKSVWNLTPRNGLILDFPVLDFSILVALLIEMNHAFFLLGFAVYRKVLLEVVELINE